MNTPALNDPPLPPVFESFLDQLRLNDLFRDLELATSILEIRVKDGASSQSSRLDLDLAILRDALWQTPGYAAQIVYEHQSQTWIDSLFRSAQGVRLVRIALPIEQRRQPS